MRRANSSCFFSFLRYPRTKNMATPTARMTVTKVSIGLASEKTKQHGHHNVEKRQHREGVAKWFVHYMPQLEYLLSTGKKQDAPGKHRALACNPDDPFELRITAGQQSAERNNGLTASHAP